MADDPQFQEDLEAYSPMAIRSNMHAVDYCRAFLAVMSGSAAGILGLTGLQGFIFYFAASLFMSVLLGMKAGKDWKRYFMSKWTIWTGGVVGELFTYLLVWTFMFGMIHVF